MTNTGPPPPSANGANRVVLGKYPERIQEARDLGGFFFDPGEQVLQRLANIGISPWRLEESFLRQQEAAGMRFDLTLRGFAPDEVGRLVSALPELAKDNDAKALRALNATEMPLYASEAKWLLQRGYVAEIDQVAGWIHWKKD
jgi:hypothetical protein